MRIVLSSAGFFPHTIGGGQTYVYGVARKLLERGHDVTVVTPLPWQGGTGDYETGQYQWDSVPVFGVAVNPGRIADVDKSSEYDAITLRALRVAIDILVPDVLHLNGLKPSLIRLSNELGIPHVVTVHHAGVACPNALLLRPDLSLCTRPEEFHLCLKCCALWRAQNEGQPLLVGKVLSNVPLFFAKAANMFSSKSDGPWIFRFLRYPWKIEHIMMADRVILNESTLIIVPSEAMAELLRRNGVPKQKVQMLPHGVEPLGATPLPLLSGQPIRFGYVGRIDRLKGLGILIDAFGRLRRGSKWELHIFGVPGSPQDKCDVERQISSFCDAKRIYDHGPISYDRLGDAYGAIDLLVVPSLIPEAFGLVVVEAFSAGRPVIVFDSGALGELVRDGIDGFVVERNNVRALSEAMQRFIDDPALVTKMAANIRPVKTMSQYVDELEVVYDRAISEFSSRARKDDCC